MIHIRRMTDADVPLGMYLKGQAGWNQTETDWRRYLDLEPDGCFLAEWHGEPAGTTTTCIFGPVAWVAMVLVDPALRGRGLGTGLMRHALAFLESRGVRTVRLDATPLGQPIYEKLGFVAEYQLARHEGILPPAAARPSEPLTPLEQDAVFQLDRRVTVTDRRKLLLRLFAEQPDAWLLAREAERPVGFLGARTGARAMQIGPCVALAEAGRELFARAWGRYAGQRVYLDIPIGNRDATRAAEAVGLTVQRHLLRMVRGEKIDERVAELWASSGPEMG